MTDADKRFHEQWIGMAQPSEGLVVSVPVLVDALPKDLSLYVVEGKQLLRPTRALKWNKPREDATSAADSTPAAQAGRPYAMLVWEVSPEIDKLAIRSGRARGRW